ncbi:MAG TPA: histidine kinase [Tenuifilaceae bacterium]|nr:histidine kinase [Tenuifilaceae bacterium]HPJ46286.1 histidine kinase [Tenuifilaceae bacterium]HPQ34660.1 histidine kinase [Tenuifilaceae bacterium]
MNFKEYIKRILSKNYIFDTTFWLVFLMIFTIAINKFEPLSESLRVGLAILIPVTIPVYLHSYFFKLFFIQKRRIALYFILLILLIALFGYINLYFGRIISGNPNAQSNTYVVTLVFIGVFTGLKYLKKFIVQQIQLQKEQAKVSIAESKQIQAELDMLKLQVNPHFLFNTLNNIYAMALDKSDELPDIVLKLSRLMRYILESSKIKFVNLDKEIEYIEDYIELEKIRLSIPKEINISKKGNLSGQYIAPLLLIAFVENSFKHGVNSKSKEFKLDVAIDCTDNLLKFEISNTIPPIVENVKKSGIGLENVKRRLDLLYHEKYKMKISEERRSFQVYLELELKNPNHGNI